MSDSAFWAIAFDTALCPNVALFTLLDGRKGLYIKPGNNKRVCFIAISVTHTSSRDFRWPMEQIWVGTSSWAVSCPAASFAG